MMHRSAAAFFCEDIRQEEGNKLSYMGIFSGDMVLPELPTIIPKFCTIVRVVAPLGRPLQRLKILVLTNDETIFESDVPEETLRPPVARTASAAPDSDTDDYRAPYPSTVRLFHLSFTNVKFNAETVIMVRLATESEILRAGAIRVVKVGAEARKSSRSAAFGKK